MQIYNLNVNEKAVNNQYVIIDGCKQIFKSYDTIIAEYDGAKITVFDGWDYSKTTLKYFCHWLTQISGHEKVTKNQIEIALKIGCCYFKNGSQINIIKG